MAKPKDTANAKPIAFDLDPEHRRAIESLAGGRRVRLSGRVEGGKVTIDFVACNSPFMACNAAFTACNAAFNACNAAFKE